MHHKYYPDCFTLSPELLLEKEKFENFFSTLGNKNYFCSLIQSKIINNNNNISGNINSKNQKIYLYMFPEWFKNGENVYEIIHTVYQYTIAFIEQVIIDRKSTRLNSSHIATSRMPSSA